MVLALGVGWALFPESVVGAVTLLVVGFSWATGDSVDVPVGALVGAPGDAGGPPGGAGRVVRPVPPAHRPRRRPAVGAARCRSLRRRGAGVAARAGRGRAARTPARCGSSGWSSRCPWSWSPRRSSRRRTRGRRSERHARQRHRLGGVPRAGAPVRRAGAPRPRDDVRRDRRGRRRRARRRRPAPGRLGDGGVRRPGALVAGGTCGRLPAARATRARRGCATSRRARRCARPATSTSSGVLSTRAQPDGGVLVDRRAERD